MNKAKSPILVLAIALVTVFAVAVALKMYYEVKGPTENSDLAYVLTTEKSDLKIGDKIEVPVYLTGKNAAKTTAYDVKFYYDPTKLKLTEAVPGGFFAKYITVKWEPKDGWFALGLTPAKPRVDADPTKPVLTLKFTAVGRAESTSVYSDASLVYLSKTGGFNPQSGQATFSIK